MIKLHKFVTFEADYPDDSQWDDQDNQIIPDGKTIAEFLAKELSEAGFPCTAVKQHSFYGWLWEATIASKQFCLVLQCPGPWLLISQPRLSLSDRLLCRKHLQLHQRLLETIDSILHQNRRIKTVKRFTKEEFEQNQAPKD